MDQLETLQQKSVDVTKEATLAAEVVDSTSGSNSRSAIEKQKESGVTDEKTKGSENNPAGDDVDMGISTVAHSISGIASSQEMTISDKHYRRITDEKTKGSEDTPAGDSKSGDIEKQKENGVTRKTEKISDTQEKEISEYFFNVPISSTEISQNDLASVNETLYIGEFKNMLKNLLSGKNGGPVKKEVISMTSVEKVVPEKMNFYQSQYERVFEGLKNVKIGDQYQDLTEDLRFDLINPADLKNQVFPAYGLDPNKSFDRQKYNVTQQDEAGNLTLVNLRHAIAIQELVKVASPEDFNNILFSKIREQEKPGWKAIGEVIKIDPTLKKLLEVKRIPSYKEWNTNLSAIRLIYKNPEGKMYGVYVRKQNLPKEDGSHMDKTKAYTKAMGIDLAITKNTEKYAKNLENWGGGTTGNMPYMWIDESSPIYKLLPMQKGDKFDSTKLSYGDLEAQYKNLYSQYDQHQVTEGERKVDSEKPISFN